MINSASWALQRAQLVHARRRRRRARALLVDMEPDIGSGSGMGAIDPWAARPSTWRCAVGHRVRGRPLPLPGATRCHHHHHHHLIQIHLHHHPTRYQMRPTNVVLDGIDYRRRGLVRLGRQVGGGKSTLVHLLLRFYDPQAGRISLGGVDYRDLNLRRSKQIGVVSQETQLFNATSERTSRTARRRTPTPSSPRRRAPRAPRVHRLVRGRPPQRRRARPASRRPEAADRDRALPVAQAEAAAPRRGEVRPRRRVGGTGPRRWTR